MLLYVVCETVASIYPYSAYDRSGTLPLTLSLKRYKMPASLLGECGAVSQ